MDAIDERVCLNGLNMKAGDHIRPGYIYIVILLILIIVNTLLARFAIITGAIGPGVAKFYFAVPFMIVFTLWFGAWGAVAAYLGCFIGAGMLGAMPFNVNLYWSLADVWQVVVPLLAFRELRANVGLKTRKDLIVFLLFGWVLNNLVGAGWGSISLAIGELASWRDVPVLFASWFSTNLLVTLVIAPLTLRYATPFILKSGLYIQKYWR